MRGVTVIPASRQGGVPMHRGTYKICAARDKKRDTRRGVALPESVPNVFDMNLSQCARDTEEDIGT